MKAVGISIVCARKMSLEFPPGKKQPFKQIASESGARSSNLGCQLDPNLIVPILKAQLHRHPRCMCVHVSSHVEHIGFVQGFWIWLFLAEIHGL